jgi:RHS repeat-associated protein
MSYPDTTTVNYIYDLDSRLTQVSDPTGTYQFTFDNMGRLTGTNTQYAFLTSRSFTTSYGYDAASNRTGFTDPEGGASSYIYDTLNRLQTLTPPAAISGGSFGFAYDALSRRTSLTRPNTVNTGYSYDNLSHLLSVAHAKGGTTIDGASYTLDNAGNRTAKTDQRTAVATSYGYDNIYQLLSATQGATTTESYTYDPVGNRTTSLGVASYTTNSSNEMTANSNASYTYDNNGNTQTKVVGSNTTTYAWDYENRMTSVTLPGSGGTVTFKYDPFGRRIYKSSSSGTSIYAYDGDNLIEETNSSGAAVARYAQQGVNIDEPLAMLRSSTTSYYHADGLGSVTSLSNSAGALAQTYTFDSFGNQTASTGSLTNPFRYTGREFDTETNLYYYRARYYDSSAGRFLSEDALEFGGKNVNFYQYAVNNPTRFVDPSGFSIICPYTNPACRATITKHLSDCAKKVLSPYFPGVNLDAIELVSELPGFASLAPIDVGAITTGNIISYQPGFFSGDASGLAALGHELTHVRQQAPGFLPFLGNYVGDYLKNLINGDSTDQAYSNIRAEKEANAMESKIMDDLFSKNGFKNICKNYCQ